MLTSEEEMLLKPLDDSFTSLKMKSGGREFSTFEKKFCLAYYRDDPLPLTAARHRIYAEVKGKFIGNGIEYDILFKSILRNSGGSGSIYVYSKKYSCSEGKSVVEMYQEYLAGSANEFMVIASAVMQKSMLCE